MAITLATLSGTVADLVGDVVLDDNTTNPNRRVKIVVDSNAPSDYIADLANDVMRLGTATTTPAADGTWSFADLIATGSADTNLDDSANLQYTVRVDYPRASDRKRVQETFGPFALTTSSDITDLVAEQALDLSYASEFMTQAQALLDAQIVLSTIDDTDSAIAAIVDDPVTLGPLTGVALAAAIGASTTQAANLIKHRYDGDGTTEPGAFIAWSADDGYTSFVDYFAMLTTKGIHGTLFLTKNWVNKVGTDPTWSDTYITQAQVQAIANAGHEIGSHAVNHEDLSTYLAANGAAALDALVTESRDYVETTFGVTCRTGAYPGGASNARVREVIGRTHEFFRGTKGVVANRGQDPFDVVAIDVQALSEAAIKLYVDDAVANGSLCVFLIHGEAPAGVAALMTKLGNVIDYADGLGVRQGSFYEGMSERTAIRGPAGASVDASGNAFYKTVRTNRLTVNRDDTVGEQAWWDLDETTNVPYFDASGGQTWEFRKPLIISPIAAGTGLQVGQRNTVNDGVLNSTTTVTSATAKFTPQDVGRTITGTGIPGSTTVAAYVSATQITLSAAATATASGVSLTLGRPNVAFAAARDADFWGSLKTHSANGVLFRDVNDDTALGNIGPSAWARSGTGGSMMWDTGTGGSTATVKAFRQNLIDHTAARKIALCTAEPSDGSINAGEVAIWFDPTNGAAKVKFKAKETGGTVRTAEVALA